VAFKGENQLTKDTAFALLHFLSHLGRDMAFDRLDARLPVGVWTVNPAVLDSLQTATHTTAPLRARASWLSFLELTQTISLETVRAISQLVCSREIQLSTARGNYAEALRLIAAGRGLAKQLLLVHCDVPFLDRVLTVGGLHSD
jgi:hypothetical protein